MLLNQVGTAVSKLALVDNPPSAKFENCDDESDNECQSVRLKRHRHTTYIEIHDRGAKHAANCY